MIPTFTTWKWNQEGYRSSYSAREVHVLRNMVRRHYAKPHVFCCVTDDPTGIDSDVKVVPMPHNFSELKNPSFKKGPNCYRRLFGFSEQARAAIGERIVSLDLDVVVTDDISPLVDRDEEFVGWGDAIYRAKKYNGSLWMLTAGARKHVWDEFDPMTSPEIANAAGYRGSDQGWISYSLRDRHEANWSVHDGVYSYRVHILPFGGRLPPDARIVIFHGLFDPWGPEAQSLEWVRQHYR